MGYVSGEWVPQERDKKKAFRVYRNLTQAHNRAYGILKANNPHLKIGIAAQLGNIQPKRAGNVLDQVIVRGAQYVGNWWFLNRIKKCQDFIGVNYYFTDYYRGMEAINPSKPANDLGWYMEPEGLYPLLREVSQRYKVPIMITENGVADAQDQYRDWWLEQTLVALERALSDGIHIIGYMHWSLLDNFEWKYGWWPRFGLLEVDRENGMRRKVRPSAKFYASKIKELSK